jgi:crotonobetainyl-CoA:carnitine CoA-transferase CaiB-like acyl-CoA transferase
MPVFDGIRVICFGSALALDLATMILSDNGAEVTRVEEPGGDPRRARPAWRMWNRGARSVVLDPDAAADRAAAVALTGRTDVLLEAWRPGEADRWGLADPGTAPGTERLVHCSVTAFGRSGPLAWIPPYDGAVEAKSGTAADLGRYMRREVPAYRARPNPSYAAAMVAVQAISAALIVRADTGRGQRVETSLYQALLSYDFMGALRTQSARGRLDPPMPEVTAAWEPFLPYLAVRCADGRWMQITNNTARLFRHWMEVIGLGEIWSDERWAGAPARFRSQEDKLALVHQILERMATRTFDEWITTFLAEGLSGDAFLTTQQALDHPQVRHNGSVVTVEDPEAGATLQLGPLAAFADSPSRIGRPAPLLGADQADLLAAAARPPAPADTAADTAAAGPKTAGPRPAAPGEATPPAGGPLAGTLVLDFASWLAGPFGTSLLADMGARVIKIESPAGDDARWSLDGRARTFQGKDSMVLDLKRPEGQEIVRRLLARADAVMHNMRGDAAARLGIDYPRARAVNPEIVYLYAGSYGSTGPGAGRAAFHPMMGALSGGVLRQVGRGNEPPDADVSLSPEERLRYSLTLSRANETSPDITGALAVGAALSMALLHRQRTGRGQYLETTMLASNLYMSSEDAIRYRGQPGLRQVDPQLRGTDALNRFYAAQDGWVFLCCPTEAEWRRLCAMLGREEWTVDPRYIDSATRDRFNDQLIAHLAAEVSGRGAAEIERLGAAHDVACVRAGTTGGADFFLSHPQSTGNGFVVQAGHPGVAPYARAGCAATFSRTPGVARVAHQFGQDGPAILAELGYPQRDIEKWLASGLLVTRTAEVANG